MEDHGARHHAQFAGLSTAFVPALRTKGELSANRSAAPSLTWNSKPSSPWQLYWKSSCAVCRDDQVHSAREISLYRSVHAEEER